ncbi:MAG: RelA/SpoT family protein [Paramuribaculum sp.]|nr:RelA/SpoT family protein [Paramuribaculum sp.]
MDKKFFTDKELIELPGLLKRSIALSEEVLSADERRELALALKVLDDECVNIKDTFGRNNIVHYLSAVNVLCEEIGADRSMIVAMMLTPLCRAGKLDPEEAAVTWGEDVAKLLTGLLKVAGLYDRGVVGVSENFRNLLMTFASDIRVIIIKIVECTVTMRAINHHPDEAKVRQAAFEAKSLYAPIAHRLGLYHLKGELEDLSLKYTSRDIYTRIARKLNETKASRDAYIADFIAPVKAELEKQGLKFDIKGRTKSISSIWNKIQKQHNDLEHIYDLFAIRIILDVPKEKERSECWLAYSVITDMYQPNPARLKDWLSIPKSNGYESLHITVRGPQSKWVEVQIRSKRMDEIAERGVAAHWKYKGIKSENNLDTWMNRVREIIEGTESGPLEMMKEFKMDIYDEEVFVFTPKGDLYKLPLGATVLDFAFNIHSRIGCTCTGGKVNGRTRKINHKLRSGDTVEIMTSASQQPKLDWLNFVVTSKARSKIRQSINEQNSKVADLGKELLHRRCKNRKIELEEASLMKLIKKMGFKTVTDFYSEIGNENLDPSEVITSYLAQEEKQEALPETRSAEEFTLQKNEEESTSDILVIGDNIKGVNYKMAKCCNPIYGDDVFGFISAEGVIKIHRKDCPNANNIRSRYPYRVITTRWSGKVGQQFSVVLQVVGHDDIGIVTNISSILNKEPNVSLRGIAIDSHDGMFSGNLTVGISDTAALNNVIKKIKTVKGVKDVHRI